MAIVVVVVIIIIVAFVCFVLEVSKKHRFVMVMQMFIFALFSKIFILLRFQKFMHLERKN